MKPSCLDPQPRARCIAGATTWLLGLSVCLCTTLAVAAPSVVTESSATDEGACTQGEAEPAASWASDCLSCLVTRPMGVNVLHEISVEVVDVHGARWTQRDAVHAHSEQQLTADLLPLLHAATGRAVVISEPSALRERAVADLLEVIVHVRTYRADTGHSIGDTTLPGLSAVRAADSSVLLFDMPTGQLLDRMTQQQPGEVSVRRDASGAVLTQLGWFGPTTPAQPKSTSTSDTGLVTP